MEDPVQSHVPAATCDQDDKQGGHFDQILVDDQVIPFHGDGVEVANQQRIAQVIDADQNYARGAREAGSGERFIRAREPGEEGGNGALHRGDVNTG